MRILFFIIHALALVLSVAFPIFCVFELHSHVLILVLDNKAAAFIAAAGIIISFFGGFFFWAFVLLNIVSKWKQNTMNYLYLAAKKYSH